jgi:hypothetical protein
MKTFFFITLFFIGLFSKEILKFTTFINQIIFKNNPHLMNKVNNFLFHFLHCKLPSFSFWIKVIIFIILIQIIYQFISSPAMPTHLKMVGGTGYFYYLNEENSNLITNMISDGNNQTTSNITNTVNNPNLTLNTPRLSVNVPGAVDGVVAATAFKAGMEVAKSIPSSAGKIIAGAAAALAIGSASKLGVKLGEQLGNQVTNNNSNTTKFLPDFELLLGKVEGLNEYPLNLLTDLSVLTSSSIVFLFLILNVFIAIYLKDKDIFLFLPNWINLNTKSGKFIKFMFNRYINIWYTSRKFILIISWIMLLFCLSIIKLGLIIILGSG